MVDKDRARKKLGGNSDGKKKKEKRSKSKSKDKDAGGSDDSGDKKVVTDTGTDSESLESKMDKFKGGSGTDSAAEGGGEVPRQDVMDTLMAIANVVLYVEGKKRSKENPQSKREEKQYGVMEAMYEYITDTISACEVQVICDKYGIDWEEDVLMEVLENQDEEELLGVK